MLGYKKGFTAIELAVVIVIMLILAVSGSINSMKGYDTMKLDAAARKVASDIRYAQNLVLTNYNNASFIPTTLYFDTCASNYYTIKRGPSGSEVTINTVDFSAGEYSGVNIDCTGTSFTNILANTGKLLQFANTPAFGDQAPYLARPYYFFLLQSGQVKLTYKGKSRTITVEQETGRVQIQ
ncbi:MAG: type II secretion system protein [Candidatus Omnitrophota bacterium]